VARHCFLALLATFLQLIPATTFAAEVTVASESSWIYYSPNYSPQTETPCVGSDQAMANILVARAATSGCDANFKSWTSSWPNTDGMTGWHALCAAPGVPITWGYQHRETRNFEYEFRSTCEQTEPSTASSSVDRHFFYYCQDENYSLTYKPSVFPLVPYCVLKTEGVDKQKQPREQNCCNVGNPINVATGSKYQREVDYTAFGPFPLKFERHYFGGEWTFSYSRSINLVDINEPHFHVAIARRDDGRELTFQHSGTYTSSADVNSRLERLPGEGWRYTDEEENVEIYDADGRLSSITTRAGLTQTLARDSIGRLISVTDTFGRQLTFTYDGAKLQTMTNAGGGVFTYAYDSDRLASVTRPDLTTVSYLYNEPAHTGGADLPSALTGIVDASTTRFATFKYDSQGRAIQSEHAGGAGRVSVTYNLDGTRTLTDALGTARTMSMVTKLGVVNLSSVTGPACPSCGTAAAYTYDSNGNVTSRTDWNGTQTSFSYTTDGRDLRSFSTQAVGTAVAFSTSTSWHSAFRLPVQITEGNRRTDFTHDSSGNVLTRKVTDTATSVERIWTYTYDAYGRVLTVDGPRTDVSDVTTFTHYTCSTGSACGQVHTITDALGHTTTFLTYNAHGQPLTLTDSNGVLSVFTYDAMQRVTSRTIGSETTTLEYWPTGLLKKVVLPDGSFTLNTYDAAHRLIRVEDQAGASIEYTLDAMGNRVAEQVYDASAALARTHTRVTDTLNRIWKDVGAAGTADVTTTYGYDNNGNPTSVLAPLGRQTLQEYDALSRTKKVTDAAGGVTQLTYDRFDNPLTVTDAQSKLTQYTYNNFGDLKQLVSPDTGTSLYTYDSGGNLATATDARGKTGTYSYDALNRVTQLSYPDRVVSFTYDAGTNGINRLTGASDSNHSLAWTYDPQGRVAGKVQTVSAVSRSIAYAYANGNLTSLVTPSGQTVAYGYANGRVDSIAVNGTTVLNNVLHEPFGPVGGWTWGNSTLAVRVFDQDGRPTLIDSAGLKTYSYDHASRVTSIEDDDDPSLNASYYYDALDRITDVPPEPPPPVPPALQLSTTSAAAGESVTVTMNDAPTGAGYWLGLAQTSAPDSTYTTWIAVTPVSGSFQWNVTMPSFAGTYEVRLFHNGFSRVSTSASITVAAPPVPSQPTIYVSANYAARGATVTMRLVSGPGGSTDWFGLSLVGSVNTSYTQWTYVGSGVTTREWTVTMPTVANSYEFRLYLNNGYTIAATSAAVSLSDSGPLGGGTVLPPYDSNGNRVFLEGSTYTTATTSNRLLGVTGAVSRTYSYDAAGNVTGDGTRNFTYNDAGRMTSVSGAASASYLHNALGQRVKKVHGGTTVYFVYDEAGHLVGEYTSTGALVQETIWLEDIPVATLRPNGSGGIQIYYVHTDHLNTPRRVSRPSDNAIVWRWDSDAFGTTAADSDPDGDTTLFTYNLRFPGQYFDAESGLHYNYFRDYDPATGRYVQSDPIGLAGGINTYGYGGGNPVAFYDPYGLEALPDSVPRSNPAPSPRAPVLPFPPRQPMPGPGPAAGVGILGQCLGIVALALTPSSVSQCQDTYVPEGVSCPDDEDRCARAISEARRIYNELSQRSIPQYMYNSRIGQADAGHHTAIQQGQGALRNALNRVRRHCTVLPLDYEKMERLANQTFPVRH
jgi:RHS repeat-associated protein